jgi:transposase
MSTKTWACTWSWTNLATHKTPAIQQWLARHPRFRLHFTPTGSSWLNQVDGGSTS